ncbi:hypothetical protein CAPTEDRAFT_114612, partial [Capitella teleta]
CYTFNTSPRSWPLAQAQCRAMGGHLVAMETEDEYNFVRQSLQNTPYVRHSWWTSATDMDREGSWVWAAADDRSMNTFGFWIENEPNDFGGEHCGILDQAHSFAMNDKNCSLKLPFICENTYG